jgi:hypothetical protein
MVTLPEYLQSQKEKLPLQQLGPARFGLGCKRDLLSLCFCEALWKMRIDLPQAVE